MALLAVALICAAPAARADDETPLDLQQAKDVEQQIDADTRVQSIFAQCPADAYIRDAPFYADYVKPTAKPAAVCGKSPEACYQDCVTHADAASCFGLARAFQSNERQVDRRYAQILFAMACDAGMGSGCTNRAASLRNNPVRGDTALHESASARQHCEFRSFRIGCTQGDAWGCAMLGQSFENGEGVASNKSQAGRFYERSCTINPDFPSCEFAKGHLRGLGPPGAPSSEPSDVGNRP